MGEQEWQGSLEEKVRDVAQSLQGHQGVRGIEWQDSTRTSFVREGEGKLHSLSLCVCPRRACSRAEHLSPDSILCGPRATRSLCCTETGSQARMYAFICLCIFEKSIDRSIP